VAAVIAPFNFPAMIPFWFMPYALACGNTYIVKPSEKVPLTMQRIFELLDSGGISPRCGESGEWCQRNRGCDPGTSHHSKPSALWALLPWRSYIYSPGLGPWQAGTVPGGRKKSVIVLPDADQEP
jgi:malonate-semialdehyde dehydrogenase (acetylating)/methylmalonate-semialdehyde dehydrogenase